MGFDNAPLFGVDFWSDDAWLTRNGAFTGGQVHVSPAGLGLQLRRGVNCRACVMIKPFLQKKPEVAAKTWETIENQVNSSLLRLEEIFK